MKKFTLALVLVSALFAQASFAAEVCGDLRREGVPAPCNVGEACPQNMRLVWFINAGEVSSELQPANARVERKMEALENQTVCAEVRSAGGGDEAILIVTSISRAMSAN